MFKQLQNIDTAFRHVRAFSLLLIAANLILTAFYVYRCEVRVQRAEDKALILLNGKVISAVTSSRKDNIPVEARDHVMTFHGDFFTLDPDDKVIKENVTKALYLADGSAKREYDNLRESGYYASIIAGNISQRVHVDSINVDINVYPHPFRCYATQSITRATSIVSRLLVTEGFLRNVSRSDNNPHGFMIERWAIVANKDIDVSNR